MLSTILQLAEISMALGDVERVTRHPDGIKWETDTTHTVMLQLVMMHIGPRMPLHTQTETGRPRQFCTEDAVMMALVHDLPEAFAGDTNTISPTPDVMAAKARRELVAMDELHRRLAGSDVMGWLERYEAQKCPESQAVRIVDKILPKLTHAMNDGATLRVLGHSSADIMGHISVQRAKLVAQYPHAPAVLWELYDEGAKLVAAVRLG